MLTSTIWTLETAHSLIPNMIIMADMNYDAPTDNGCSKVTETSVPSETNHV